MVRSIGAPTEVTSFQTHIAKKEKLGYMNVSRSAFPCREVKDPISRIFHTLIHDGMWSELWHLRAESAFLEVKS